MITYLVYRMLKINMETLDVNLSTTMMNGVAGGINRYIQEEIRPRDGLEESREEEAPVFRYL